MGTSSTESKPALRPEPAGARDGGPVRTPTRWLREFIDRRLFNSALLFGVIPVGTAFGHFVSKLIALPQLRRLVVGEVPWSPLRKSLADSTVALVSTGGVHLRSDRPFNLNGDLTFRVIPKGARPADLAISHQAYDRTAKLILREARLRESGFAEYRRHEKPTTGSRHQTLFATRDTVRHRDQAPFAEAL